MAFVEYHPTSLAEFLPTANAPPLIYALLIHRRRMHQVSVLTDTDTANSVKMRNERSTEDLDAILSLNPSYTARIVVFPSIWKWKAWLRGRIWVYREKRQKTEGGLERVLKGLRYRPTAGGSLLVAVKSVYMIFRCRGCLYGVTAAPALSYTSEDGCNDF